MSSIWDERPEELKFHLRHSRLELVRICEEGINKCKKSGKKFWYLQVYSRALADVGQLEAAGPAVDTLLAEANALGTDHMIVALSYLAFQRLYTGDDVGAMSALEQAFAIPTNDPFTNCHLTLMRCYFNTVTGKLAQAIADGLKTIAIAEQFNLQEILPRAHQDISIAFHAASLFSDSEKHSKLALEYYRMLGYPAGGILSNLANAINAQGRPLEARAIFLDALNEVRQNTHVLFEMRILCNLAYVHCILNEYPKALDFGKQAFELSRSNNDKRSAGTALVWLARAEHGLGNYERSIDYANLRNDYSLQEEHQFGELLKFIPDAYAKLGKFEDAYEWQTNSLTFEKDLR